MTEAEKIQSIKDKLLNATGKYSDYRRYEFSLENLDEEYDETLELYNFDIWLGKSGGTIRDKAAHMLRTTLALFHDMADNARKELQSVLQEIMDCTANEQKEIWGKDLFLDKSKMSEEDLKELLWEWEEFPYSQNESLNYFIKLVEESI